MDSINFFQSQEFLTLWEQVRDWIMVNVLAWTVVAQLTVVTVAFVIALMGRKRLVAWLHSRRDDSHLWRAVRRTAEILEPLSLYVIWTTSLWVMWLLWLTFIAGSTSLYVLNTVSSLLVAWIIICIFTGLLRGGSWARVVAIAAWTVAALNILGLLDTTVELLNGISMSFGDIRISALGVVKGILAAGILLWMALALSRFLERRLKEVGTLSPSVQVLSIKLAKILLVSIALLLTLSSLGIDLTAFAVVGGAIGVGIGFGLQKVVSNLISGVILLLDRSIKPGDVIELGEAYGWINTLGARYASVVTRDGMEYLIPNEDLITQRVVNWSFTFRQVRLKASIGISYDSDIHKAIALSIEAAQEERRVLKDPAPKCLLKGFGDNSLDLELRFWIRDPENGMANITSAVLLRVWDKFQAQGIKIPYPHRELILKEDQTGLDMLSVEGEKEERASSA